MTGASKVLIFDHTFRSTESNPKVMTNHDGDKNKAVAPAGFIHADLTVDSGPKRLAQIKESGAYFTTSAISEEDWLKRFQVYNVWRPTTEHPVVNFPLAVCDTNSISDDEMKIYSVKYAHRTG